MSNHNKRNSGSTAILLVLAMICMGALTAPAADLDPALQKIVDYRFGESSEALTIVEDMVREARGNSTGLLELEKQFAAILSSDATYDCKEFICRQLWLMGTKESVPSLSKLLGNQETSDIARYALECNLSPEAGRALRGALKNAEGLALIGIVNSLGERHDRESVGALSRLVSTWERDILAEQKKKEAGEEKKGNDEKKITSEDVAIAAVTALAKIGGVEAGKTLKDAKEFESPAIRNAASKAFLLWADNFVSETAEDD